MKLYTNESLEILRNKVNLFEVLSSFVPFKSNGAFYKALCPFHSEKTPSFMLKRSDVHYHCYGCGAHGDAFKFLMVHQGMTFPQTIEYLADKFSVEMELEENKSINKSNKPILKQILYESLCFFHFFLIKTKEGEQAIKYLYNRGIYKDFILNFKLGLAPKNSCYLQKMLNSKKFLKKDLIDAGILSKNSGSIFFTDRIIIPIYDIFNNVVGFTARKYKDTSTFGPKYINSPETLLFKKSKILFGLNYCRSKIIKTKTIIIVEGQIDCLKLIYNGFDFCVASQGTAFSDDQVKQIIRLGVKKVYVAFDSDDAGIVASVKLANALQQEGLDVLIVKMDKGLDPDAILAKDNGKINFQKLLDNSMYFIDFLISIMKNKINTKSPAQLNDMVKKIANMVKKFKDPVMVYASLKKLSKATGVPEHIINEIKIKPIAETFTMSKINPNILLEEDILRILILAGKNNDKIVKIAKKNLKEELFYVEEIKFIFSLYMKNYDIVASSQNEHKQEFDILSFVLSIKDVNVKNFILKILQKNIDLHKALGFFTNSVQKLLNRNWLSKIDAIKIQIQSKNISEKEATDLAKQFDAIKNNKPNLDLSG